MKHSITAVAWFVLSLSVSVCNDALTKVLNESTSASTIAFWRFVFSFILLIPIVIKFGLNSIQTSKIHIHMLRGFILSAAMSLWCYGIKFVPIATVTLMSLTVPMFTILMAAIFLREKISFEILIATFIGFTGSIMTLSSQNITFSLTAGIFIIASILFATLDILNKMLLNSKEKILPMIFYSNLFSAIFIIFIPNTLKEAFNVNFYELVLLCVLGMGANLILFCIIKAFSKAPASFLAPIKYLELLMSITIGFLFFKEIISVNILIGGALIVLSSIIINHKIQGKTTVEKV